MTAVQFLSPQKSVTFLPKEQLTVWLPLKCHDTSWVSVAFADDELAKTVKKYARLGLWILSNKRQLAEAEKLGADVIETNGRLKPELNAGTIADMHTHSENSHDSICKIEDMLASQKTNGTKIFAVTDHFDTASFNDYDVFAPIKNAAETVKELNEKMRMTLLFCRELKSARDFGILKFIKRRQDWRHMMW